MAITAAQVKELREKTGAGIMDAKKALTETDGDMEKAMEFLRQKGIASADKKMSRIAAEGLVASYIEDGVGAMIEVNCETDFVAKNPEFKELTENLAKQVVKANPADVDALLASTCPCCNMKVEDKIKEKIAKIGEKITVRRFIRIEGCPATYIHNGKIGVLMNTDKADEAVQKDVCLHIASAAPEFVSRNEIPQDVINEETRIEKSLKAELTNSWLKNVLLNNRSSRTLMLQSQTTSTVTSLSNHSLVGYWAKVWKRETTTSQKKLLTK